MCNESNLYNHSGDIDMQKIDFIVSELKTIMQSSDISQNSIISALDGKCARNTILSFFKGDADCKLSTLLMILDACGVDLRFETERSREAIIAQDISDYRKEADILRSELDSAAADRDFYKSRYEELINKNTALTGIVEKQQTQIEKYMERMEHAEEALYSSNADARRKDAKIVELLKALEKW